jgi:hypothetical protein
MNLKHWLSSLRRPPSSHCTASWIARIKSYFWAGWTKSWEFTTTRICKASTKITFAIFGQSGQGVQLELSQPLRYSFFASFDKRGRERRTPQGDKFVDAVRKAILGGNAGAARKADKSNESQAFGFAAGGTKGSGDGGAGFL